jgi:hypothetical protein
MLRSVGIPAHPVTADAALEDGDADWTFDTWVEFLVPVGGTADWRVLHPHEYPGISAENRSTFSLRGVATKAFNDLILMAGESWLWSEVADSAADVSYTRISCGEPLQLVTKKVWVDELCEVGYWSPQTHWDCLGVETRSLRAEVRWEPGDLRYGAPLVGLVNLENVTRGRSFGTIVIELVGHRPESMRFPEATFDAVTTRVTIEPGRTVALPFRLRLPPTRPPGFDLYVRVRDGERTVLLQPIQPPDALRAALQMPQSVRVGDEVPVTAVISNVGPAAVTGVTAALRLPFALEVKEGVEIQIGELPVGSQRQVTWLARAVAPLEAGMVRLLVGSADGGAADAAVAVTIPDPRPGPPAERPGLRRGG